MTKKGLLATTALLALLLPREALAQVVQGDSPQWLKDRRYGEGAGIREGDLELHPGMAGEVGYDSNWFLRSSSSGFANSGGAPAFAPPIPALVFRITPSLYISTLSPQRREGDLTTQPPSIRFRAGLNATYREFIGLSSDSAASQPQNDISQQRNIGGNADARLDIFPERPFGAVLLRELWASHHAHVGLGGSEPLLQQGRRRRRGRMVVQPGEAPSTGASGTSFAIHCSSSRRASRTTTSRTSSTRAVVGSFGPRTALVYDATFQFIYYANQAPALAAGLVNSTPVRARIGLNGLVTDRFTVLGLVGWGASFYDTTWARSRSTTASSGRRS